MGPESAHRVGTLRPHRVAHPVYLLASYQILESYHATNLKGGPGFFAQVHVEPQAVVMLMVLFLPKGKLHLSLDRTEWDFGSQQWNVLMLTAYSEGVGLPLWWSLLDNNSGNSNTQDRTKLLTQVVTLLGPERIGSLCADREFIGKDWYKWL